MNITLKSIELEVCGLEDERDVRSICSALTAIPGVRMVEVCSDSGFVCVQYDGDMVMPRQFRIALFAMGFEAHVVLDKPRTDIEQVSLT